jgi:hypothetical protein
MDRLLNTLDFVESVNTPGGDPEPLADQPVRLSFASQPPDLLPEFCGPFSGQSARGSPPGSMPVPTVFSFLPRLADGE